MSLNSVHVGPVVMTSDVTQIPTLGDWSASFVQHRIVNIMSMSRTSTVLQKIHGQFNHKNEKQTASIISLFRGHMHVYRLISQGQRVPLGRNTL